MINLINEFKEERFSNAKFVYSASYELCFNKEKFKIPVYYNYGLYSYISTDKLDYININKCIRENIMYLIEKYSIN